MSENSTCGVEKFLNIKFVVFSQAPYDYAPSSLPNSLTHSSHSRKLKFDLARIQKIREGTVTVMYGYRKLNTCTG